MENMNMWKILKESSDLLEKYLGALHTPYHTDIISN